MDSYGADRWMDDMMCPCPPQGDRGDRGTRGLSGSPGPVGPAGAKVHELRIQGHGP